MKRLVILLALAALPAAAQSVYQPDYWKRAMERMKADLAARKPAPILDTSLPAYVTVDKDVAGTTIKYAPPTLPPVVIRTYPGRFSNVTVQRGTQVAKPLGSTSVVDSLIEMGILRPWIGSLPVK